MLGHDGTSSWIHWTVERRGGAKGGGGMAKGKTEAMTPLPELLALVPPLPSSKRPRWRRRHIPLTETALPCRRLLTMAPQLMGNEGGMQPTARTATRHQTNTFFPLRLGEHGCCRLRGGGRGGRGVSASDLGGRRGDTKVSHSVKFGSRRSSIA